MPIHSRKRIALVVDDEEDICEFIEDLLKDVDIDVKTATTAEEGLREVAHFIIDIAIIDIFMPGKGGLWLVKQIRYQHPKAEIIVISGGWQAMSAKQTLKAVEKIGFRNHLSKPLAGEYLRDLIVKTLEKMDQ